MSVAAIEARHVWSQHASARRYGRRRNLFTPEKKILRDLGRQCPRARTLDLGVGGGRTTQHLLDISSSYLGVDYSPSMIERCRALYPGVAFKVLDARDLSGFPDDSFDVALFSFNGIDNFAHPDRLAALREFRRVVTPGGRFVFSTHNAAHICQLRKPWSLWRLHREPLCPRSLYWIPKRLPGWLGGIVRSYVNQDREFFCDSYALVNDGSENYRLLQYYISIPEQVKQLRACGFEPLEVVDQQGRSQAPAGSPESTDPWLYYVCRPR